MRLFFFPKIGNFSYKLPSKKHFSGIPQRLKGCDFSFIQFKLYSNFPFDFFFDSWLYIHILFSFQLFGDFSR